MRKAALGRAIQSPYANEIKRSTAGIYPPWGGFSSTAPQPKQLAARPQLPGRTDFFNGLLTHYGLYDTVVARE
jgi:hypothetical protein